MIVKKALKHYSFLVIGCLLYRVETPWQNYFPHIELLCIHVFRQECRNKIAPAKDVLSISFCD